MFQFSAAPRSHCYLSFLIYPDLPMFVSILSSSEEPLLQRAPSHGLGSQSRKSFARGVKIEHLLLLLLCCQNQQYVINEPLKPCEGPCSGSPQLSPSQKFNPQSLKMRDCHLYVRQYVSIPKVFLTEILAYILDNITMLPHGQRI